MENIPDAQPADGEARFSDRLLRGNVLDVDCPSRGVLRNLTGKWTVLALIVLEDGVHRFAELRRRIPGVSDRMLAQTLQALEQDGMVERRAYPVVPPHVDYRLTPLGTAAAARVRALADWVEANIQAVLDARAAMEAPAMADA